MAPGVTLTLVLADFAADRLQSILITRTAPPYQELTGVLVHALTNGFFWLAAWLIAGGSALAGVLVLAGLLRRTGRRALPLPPAGAEHEDHENVRLLLVEELADTPLSLAVVHQPAVVVGATSAADVQAAVRFAAHQLAVSVSSTGHGTAMAATEDALMIITRRMRGVTIDPVAKTARVEAGVRWQQVTHTLHVSRSCVRSLSSSLHSGRVERLCRTARRPDGRGCHTEKEGFVDVAADLPAGTQATEPVQQRDGLRHGPAVGAQPGPVFGAAWLGTLSGGR